MRTLVTSRCTLEPQVAAHAPEMFVVLADPAIYEFENAPPASEARLAWRYARLESRVSDDGTQQGRNWVIRLPSGALAGYLQATVLPGHTALVADELNSRHWRQGIGSSAVQAMLQELADQYGVATFVAVLKAANGRSEGLLRKLGFTPASQAQALQYRDEADEAVFVKTGAAAPAGGG